MSEQSIVVVKQFTQQCRAFHLAKKGFFARFLIFMANRDRIKAK